MAALALLATLLLTALALLAVRLAAFAALVTLLLALLSPTLLAFWLALLRFGQLAFALRFAFLGLALGLVGT